MSTPGRLSKSFIQSGFSMIELIMVISLLSLLLIFTFPVINDIKFFSDKTGDAGDIIRLIEDLKKRAVEHNQNYSINIDRSAGTLWVTHKNMDGEQIQAAREKQTTLSDSLLISDVEFLTSVPEQDNLYKIGFNRHGYSDSALIHIVNDDREMTIKIEAFLSSVNLIDQHISYQDCQ